MNATVPTSPTSDVLAKIAPTLQHVMLVTLMFAAIFLVGAPSVTNFANDKAREWLGQELKLLGDTENSEFTSHASGDSTATPSDAQARAPETIPPNASLSAPFVERLETQAAEARRGARTHLKITVFFSVRYYASITIASYLALLAAICFAFVSRDGWAQSSPYLVTSFIVLSMSTTYFAAVPSLYQLPQNIDSNKLLYADFKRIISSIQSYAASWSPESKTLVPNDAFVLAVDKELASLRSLPLTFNVGALKDLQKDLETIVDKTVPSAATNSADVRKTRHVSNAHSTEAAQGRKPQPHPVSAPPKEQQ